MDWVLLSLRVAGEVLLIVLLADFAGGLFHWAEDTLGDVSTPVWGPVFVAPNEEHHDRPSAMLTNPWWRSGRLVIAACALVLAGSWALGLLTWQVVLFVALTGFNDEAHLLEHTPTGKLPWIVLALRRAHVLQTARHHWQHHRPPHTSHYCVLTPWLNPMLDSTRFWRGMEAVFVPAFGAPRRPDLR